MRRAQTQIPMYSNSIGCPKIFPPSAPVLYWLSHLTCISSLKAKNERKTLIFTQLEISRYKQHFFSLFLDEFLETDLRPIYCSLTREDSRDWKDLRLGAVAGCSSRLWCSGNTSTSCSLLDSRVRDRRVDGSSWVFCMTVACWVGGY